MIENTLTYAYMFKIIHDTLIMDHVDSNDFYNDFC